MISILVIIALLIPTIALILMIVMNNDVSTNNYNGQDYYDYHNTKQVCWHLDYHDINKCNHYN